MVKILNYELIQEKQRVYCKLADSPISAALLSYEAAFDIEYTHNSTAIEGNTLTLIETKLILEDSISVGGKKLREIYEVVNHSNAYKYVKKSIANGVLLDEKIIKDIHAILMDHIIVGGIYRNEQVYISGASHMPPSPQKMYEQIKDFYTNLTQKQMNPIELAAWTHAEFVRIHPFIDGNGRTARLIMNYQLLSNGFPAISINQSDRLSYFNGLEEYAVNNNLNPFADMIANLVEDRLDMYNSMT